MRPRLVVVSKVVRQDSRQVILVQHDDVVQTLPVPAEKSIRPKTHVNEDDAGSSSSVEDGMASAASKSGEKKQNESLGG